MAVVLKSLSSRDAPGSPLSEFISRGSLWLPAPVERGAVPGRCWCRCPPALDSSRSRPGRPRAPAAASCAELVRGVLPGFVGGLGVRGHGCAARQCRGPAPIAPPAACTRASPPRTGKPVIPGTAVFATNSPSWPITQPRTRTRLSPERSSRAARYRIRRARAGTARPAPQPRGGRTCRPRGRPAGSYLGRIEAGQQGQQ